MATAERNLANKDFLSPELEARAFRRLRHRILVSLLRQMLVQARFRFSLVILLTAMLWGGMFWMFTDGFRFLQATITNSEMHARTVSVMFVAFFAALLVMLVFSAGIILYSSLFRAREIPFLLTTPARAERIFLHKFHEAIILSGWGFGLLGSPMLLAYGYVSAAPWPFYFLLVPLLLAFVYIAVAVGATITLWIVHRIPDNRLAVLITSVILVLCGILWIIWEVFAGPRNDLLTPGWFQEILERLQVSDQRLLPHWWLSMAILDAAAGLWSETLQFLALMLSNALFFRQVALWTAGRIYRRAYSSLYDKSLRRKQAHAARGDRLLSALLKVFPAPMRLMMIKDLRLFRRDPLQWSQFLIFLGLLVLYFLNIRRFSYDMSSIAWVNMVSFLNLAVVGLLLSTFTTRFIFPLLSLEGRRFWCLGLLGVRREMIVWGKFAFALVGSIIPCSSLVLVSDLMLNAWPIVLISHQLTCLMLCLGLSGIAVGFGAWLPSLRDESPSRIAAGFGGTLTLVISTLYILVVVLFTALPMHFYLVAEYATTSRGLYVDANIEGWILAWLAGGILGSVLLGILATWLPLGIGLRAFRRLEF